MAGSSDAVTPGDAPLPGDSQLPRANADPDPSLPRLAAVIERQRRELILARADAQAAEVAAMARGVLMERQGLSPVAAIRQLADMAAAAGIPVTEMAAAVLRQEPPSAPAESASAASAPAASADPARAGERLGAGEWLEPGQRLDGAAETLALAAITRARDGVELVGALAGQLGPRFEAAAVAVWLLDADGALELLGQDGLDGTDSSRWRRLPPQFDCPEQRVVAAGAELWWESGPPPSDPVAVAAPWGRRAARAVLPLRDRAGPCSAWPRPGGARLGGSSTQTPAVCWRRWSPGSPTCSARASPTAPSGRQRRPRRSSPCSTRSRIRRCSPARCAALGARSPTSPSCT